MRAGIGAAVLTLGVASTALAVPKGGTLYVKAKNTRLMESSAKAANVVRLLQPGQAVTWLGADPSNRQWHLVEVDGKKGVVFQSNLSTKPPNLELVAGTGKVGQKEAAAFANSAAAVKLLSEGATKYGTQKGGDYARAVKQLEQLEALAKTIQEPQYTEHARKAGLSLVAGPAASGARKSVAKEGAK